MEQKYIRYCAGLDDKGELIPVQECKFDEFEADQDCYASLYYYTKDHYDHFQKKGTVRGITDVVTDKLLWDFDDKKNIENARKDAIETVNRIQETLGVSADNVEIYFSGNKGFTLGVKIDKMITPKEHAQIALHTIGKGLPTLDKSVYNASRIIRLPRTKHQATSFYKTALTHSELEEMPMTKIQERARTVQPNRSVAQVILPAQLLTAKKEEPVKLVTDPVKFDMSDRPRHIKEYKWALMNAHALKPGERTNAMMIIASTCRALGYTRDITEGFLASFDTKYAQNTGQEQKPEMIQDKLNSIFADGWNGGQYSVKNNPWLQEYCERVGIREDQDEEAFITIEDVAGNFDSFANEFESNIVRTGIQELDEKALFLTSTHNGLLGQPGSGKTSFSLQWLRNCAEEDNSAVFYSLDMAKPIVYGKLVQQEWGCDFKSAIEKYGKDRIQREIVQSRIKERYKNVSFNFKTGVSVQQMEDDVKRFEDQNGKKVRLLVVDYLECLQGPYSDQTANTGYISNQMKDLANKLGVCSVMLLQTQKHSTSDVSQPLESMKQIKGSSVIEQASSVVLTLWREGYTPQLSKEGWDKFISFSIVKNRFGGLWTGDFSWNGRNGVVDSLTDEQIEELVKLRELKKKQKLAADSNNGWG